MCGSDDQAVDYFSWGVRVLARRHRERAAATARRDPRRRPAATTRSPVRLFERILPWVQDMEAGCYNQKAKLGLATSASTAARCVSRCCRSIPTTAAELRVLDEALASTPRPALMRARADAHRASRPTPRASRARATSAASSTSRARPPREKLHHVNEVDDTLRRFLCFEPRGRAAGERQPRVPVDRPRGRRRLHHPAGRPCARDERLEHDLRRHGAARDRHDPDDASPRPGRRSRRRRGSCAPTRPAATAAASASRSTASPSFVEALDVPLARARLRRPRTSTSPTAAATTCSPTPPSSVCS